MKLETACIKRTIIETEFKLSAYNGTMKELKIYQWNFTGEHQTSLDYCKLPVHRLHKPHYLIVQQLIIISYDVNIAITEMT